MIRYQTGDLLQARVDALVNAVNCVGVMGKGLALQFRQAYPEVYRQYAADCKQGRVRPGSMHVVRPEQGPLVINFPTKRHFRGKSRYEDIESGLAALRAVILEHQVRSVALPALGCGLGGLDWGRVQPLIERSLGDLEGIEVQVFLPGGENCS